MEAHARPAVRARSGVRSAAPSRLPGWVRSVMRAPLFWKLLVPQLALVGVLLAVASAALPGVASARIAVLVLAAGPVVTVVLSAWMVRLALQPVDDLAETAHRVAAGDWTARAPESPLADHRIDHLGRVFNEMLDALADARLTQRDHSRQVLAAEERERERVAHELYAGTAQTLAGVLIRLRVFQTAVDGSAALPMLDEVTSQVRLALEEVRTVARRLRPPELDELGVRAALEAHGRRLAESSGLPIHFEGTVPEQALDPGARLALFRIVQEGLTNAVLHAGASRVDVRFAAHPDMFRAEVVDDGSGFEPEAAEPTTDSHLGLVGMRERADYVQGVFSILSTPGHGTVLRLDLPWAPNEPTAEPPASPLRVGLPTR